MDRYINVKRAKRQRYLELAVIANELCAFLEDKGVDQNEGCKVRRLAEDMWEQGRHISLDNALREPTLNGGEDCCEAAPQPC